jgi:hypothetical protein
MGAGETRTETAGTLLHAVLLAVVVDEVHAAA